jgi:hypothetical protein
MAAKRPKKGAPAGVDDRPRMPTSINMPLDLLDLLQDAARARAKKIRDQNVKLPKGQRIGSSRPSVSQLVVELLERHRDEIKALADGD